MICAECEGPDGRYIVPGGHDVLCWRCYTRRLGADEDIPEPATQEAMREVAGRLRREYEERQRASAPGDTAAALGAVERFIRRFSILPSSDCYVALSLFVLHTWAFHVADATAYIVIESPEKQSGKTRLLEVMQLACQRPLKVASITAAALFQSVAEQKPTLLIDEADAIFGGHTERNEDLRAVLNAGNMPGSPVIRGGKDGKPVTFDVFCPKVIAGIATGRLPDTVRDRSIVIPIDRKLRSEQVERLRRRRLSTEVDQLRAQLLAWADQHARALTGYDLPAPMERISDRLEEAWEPLLAIADLAGAGYPTAARAAAEALAGDSSDDDGGAAHTLLMALRTVFGDETKLSSKTIVAALNADPDMPFAGWNDGNGITTNRLAVLLRRYRVTPRSIRLDAQRTLKGYQREQFESAWARYGATQGVTAGTTQRSSGFPALRETAHDPRCDVSENGANARPVRDVTAVTAQNAQTHATATNGTAASSHEEAVGAMARADQTTNEEDDE